MKRRRGFILDWRQTSNICSWMKRGIVHSILLFYSSHIERMNSCREERLHLFQGLGHISSVKVLSKRSRKVEEFFPEGSEKVTRGGGRDIYIRWRNFGKIFLSQFSGGGYICLVHFGLKWTRQGRGGSARVVFGEKLKGVLVNNAINICEHSNRSLLFAVVELGRRENRASIFFRGAFLSSNYYLIVINDFCNEYYEY